VTGLAKHSSIALADDLGRREQGGDDWKELRNLPTLPKEVHSHNTNTSTEFGVNGPA
jgi:hypothetical protein